MSWFFRLFGFEELLQGARNNAFQRVRDNLTLTTTDGSHVLTTMEGKKFWVGRYTQQSLASLHETLGSPSSGPALSYKDVFGNVATLHADRALAGSLFQVASQFNVLEMAAPEVSPDAGITCYQHDRTQGPACAMACPAGTVFRNYFINGTGQDCPEHQVNGLKEAHTLLLGMQQHNPQPLESFWSMQNGYCMPESHNALQVACALLDPSADGGVDRRRRFMDAITFGAHWDTQVRDHAAAAEAPVHECHKVAQIFCSALPVAYNEFPSKDWTHLATAVLQAAYEATLAVAANLSKQRSNERVPVYLTRLGGGVFGNNDEWIDAAIKSACTKYEAWPIDVMMVNYRP